MSGTGQSGIGVPDARNVVLHSRYIKEFSFENPCAPAAPAKEDLRFDVSVQVDGERWGDLHEIVLSIAVTAAKGTERVFSVELRYAGLFELIDLGREARSRFIFCEAPRILFPWVERIVAAATRDGGLPPLNLTQPDFAEIYRRKCEAARKEVPPRGPGAGAPHPSPAVYRGGS